MKIKFALIGAAVGLVLSGLLAESAAAGEAVNLLGYRQEAERGNAKSQYALGFMYDTGRVVPQNHTKALYWYRKAAAQGNAKAQFGLGRMYQRGVGVTKSGPKAIKWYRLAAEKGHTYAQMSLSAIYMGSDWVQAHMWSNLAAANMEPGQMRSATTKVRDLAASQMTPAQLSEAQEMAEKWKRK